MRVLTAIGCLFGILATTSCQERAPAAAGPPLVYTTFPVVEAITRAVLGPHADVARLLNAGQSPHSYEPTPSDARKASRALLIVYAADNLDRWAARVADVKMVSLMKLVPDSLKYPANSASPDPHFWLDPIVVRSVVSALANELCGMLPAYCEELRSNAEAFGTDLAQLDAEIRNRLSILESRTVVQTTPFFGYFARRYDLQVVATLGKSDMLDNGPRRIADLVGSMNERKAGVNMVVSEANESQVVARMLAELLGARLVLIDPVGRTDEPGSYRDLMLQNVERILGPSG